MCTVYSEFQSSGLTLAAGHSGPLFLGPHVTGVIFGMLLMSEAWRNPFLMDAQPHFLENSTSKMRHMEMSHTAVPPSWDTRTKVPCWQVKNRIWAGRLYVYYRWQWSAQWRAGSGWTKAANQWVAALCNAVIYIHMWFSTRVAWSVPGYIVTIMYMCKHWMRRFRFRCISAAEHWSLKKNSVEARAWWNLQWVQLTRGL